MRVVYTQTCTLGFDGRVPAYTTFIDGSLTGSPGVAYAPDADAVSGTLSLRAREPATVTYAMQVGLTGTAGLALTTVNRACVYPPGGGLADCEWSNEVWTLHVCAAGLPAACREVNGSHEFIIRDSRSSDV